MDNDDDPNLNSLFDHWWVQILIGLMLFGVAALLYWFFSYLESEGAPARLPLCCFVVYGVGGKWAAAGIVALPGLLFLWAGVRSLIAVIRGEERDS